MKVAIIGGTGIERLPGITLEEMALDTPYGKVMVYRANEHGSAALYYLNRHGSQAQTPPHQINFRGNLKALHMLGVERILATNAVGSIDPGLPPGSLAVLDDFIDFTSGRILTFYDGGESGHAYTEMSEPYCPALRQRLLALAAEFDLELHPRATYVCTNGPRFETPSEINMFSRLGGEVVGMTGVPEVVLAKELGIHYAAVAYSINWAAGLEPSIRIVKEGIPDLLARLLSLLIKTLQYPESFSCYCTSAVHWVQPPR
ncbi:MAG: MTAP family purine nucleoside phosphorylase [Anaerolineaceae bacterium]